MVVALLFWVLRTACVLYHVVCFFACKCRLHSATTILHFNCLCLSLSVTHPDYCYTDAVGQQDGYLISSSSSSVNSIALCSSSSDYFVSQAAQIIDEAYDHTFSGSTDNTTLLGHTVTSTGKSTLNSGLLNVVSLSRSAAACVDVYCLLVCLVNCSILRI